VLQLPYPCPSRVAQPAVYNVTITEGSDSLTEYMERRTALLMMLFVYGLVLLLLPLYGESEVVKGG
jgi:hypothetical protein